MIRQAILLAMILVAVRNEPDGQPYLPPNGARNSHPDEWAGDPVNYEFIYDVQDAKAGLDFGHREMRKDMEAIGTYHVMLPDGRRQIVDYVADQNGYRPVVRYEGTATYPASDVSNHNSKSADGYHY